MNPLPVLLALFAIAGSGTAAAASDSIIEPHTAVYRVKISIASGTLTTHVSRNDDGYQVRSVIEPKGLAGLLMSGTIEENSVFDVTDSGVTPRLYWSNDTLSSDPKRMDFRFDPAADTVSGTINDETVRFELDREAHDRVSIQYELMHNLVSGSDSGDYALLDGDELKEIEITNVGTRRISVPYGTFDAVGIQHQAEGSRRVTTLWCAEALGYLPVLIEQSRKGKVKVRAVLADYVPESAEAEAAPSPAAP